MPLSRSTARGMARTGRNALAEHPLSVGRPDNLLYGVLCRRSRAPNELVALESSGMTFGWNCRASRLARLVELAARPAAHPAAYFVEWSGSDKKAAWERFFSKRALPVLPCPAMQCVRERTVKSALQVHTALSPFGKCERSQAAAVGEGQKLCPMTGWARTLSSPTHALIRRYDSGHDNAYRH